MCNLGNHAISHNPNGLGFRASKFCISVVPINNLASIRLFNRSEITPRALAPGHCLRFLSNDIPVIFQVFINIHEYTNEMIFE